MKYLLTFKPLKNFFFGNERNFTEDYFAISDYFPQNTQLLGAIRLFIAEQNALMHVHKNGKYSNNHKELTELIGNAGSKDFSSNEDLGKIKNLSSMFIVKSTLDDAYFKTPFDIEIGEDSIKTYQISQINSNYFLSDYDVKNSSYQQLGNGEFWQSYLTDTSLAKDSVKSFDYIFKKHSQVGIGLENKKTIDGAFYTKIDFNLLDGFLFGAIIELDEKIIDNGIIQIGAESSLFELKVSKLEESKLAKHPIVSNLFNVCDSGRKLVLLSDAMMDTDSLNYKFHLVPFEKKMAMILSSKYKHIKTEDKDKTKSSNNDYSKFLRKSKTKRLVPQGSVFYMKENHTIESKAEGAYKKMGFNQFIAVKS